MPLRRVNELVVCWVAWVPRDHAELPTARKDHFIHHAHMCQRGRLPGLSVAVVVLNPRVILIRCHQVLHLGRRLPQNALLQTLGRTLATQKAQERYPIPNGGKWSSFWTVRTENHL